MKIGIIGAGNIGGALADGLLASGTATAADIILSDPSKVALSRFAQQGVGVARSNRELAEQAKCGKRT
jgi:pyrroline-5-carboxylate reductase